MADPTVSQVFQTSIPQQLLPYAETLLNQAQAFTDINKYPYQQYQGEQVAQFSPLQQQAYQAAGQLQVPGQIGAGTDIAQAAGLSALGAQYDPTNYATGSFTQPYTAAQYMSPFMQNVVQTQQQEAIRQANIANTALGAQATRAGAFGGARQAIEQAQANRNLQTQLGNIQATGLQNAYQQAMQQFNTEQQARQQAAQMREQSRQFGAGLGMQGLQTGLQAASTLGGLGQQQAQQQAQNIGLQAQLGQQQQQNMQNILNAQYQDFLNYQNYPYKQLGFMSDIIRGAPLTQTGSSVYQAPPTAMQNVMSLGLGAYGLNQLGLGKAGGGEVKGYAKGGLTAAYAAGGSSVMSPEFKRYAVDHIDPRQLPLAQRNALMRGDRETAGFAADEMAIDAAIRRGSGLAAAFTPEMADNIVRAAGGGILAFQEGGTPSEQDLSYSTEGSSGSGGDFTDMQLAQLAGMAGDGQSVESGNQGIYAAASNAALNTAKEIRALRYQGYTDDQINDIIKKRFALEEQLAGPSPYGEMQKYLASAKTDRAAALEQGKGLAALEAAGAVLQPGGTMRGLGAAGSAFAKSYGQALQADRAEKRALASMQFNLADAQRKERMGMTKSAIAAAAEAEKNKRDAYTAGLNKLKAQGDIEAKVAAANRPIKIGGAGSKEPKVAEQNYANILENLRYTEKPKDGESPKAFEARIKRMASQTAVAEAKTSDVGPGKIDIEGKKILTNLSIKSVDEANKEANREAASRNLFGKPGGQDEIKAIFDRKYKEAMGRHAESTGMSVDDMIRETGGIPKHSVTAPAADATKATGAPDIKSVAGAPAGATIGKKTVQGYEILDSTGKLIGYAKGKP